MRHFLIAAALLVWSACGPETGSLDVGLQGDFAANPALNTDFGVDLAKGGGLNADATVIRDSAVDAIPSGDLSAGSACPAKEFALIPGTPCQPLGLQCTWFEYQSDCECSGWVCAVGPVALENLDCGAP